MRLDIDSSLQTND